MPKLIMTQKWRDVTVQIKESDSPTAPCRFFLVYAGKTVWPSKNELAGIRDFESFKAWAQQECLRRWKLSK
jgi:hypothetical protein